MNKGKWPLADMFNEKEKQVEELEVKNEKLIERLEGVANYLRGVALDPQIPFDVKVSLRSKVEEIDDLAEKLSA